MPAYNNRLNTDDQIDTEEQIAATLFDDPDVEISEAQAADMGRRILLIVLMKFRPDLIEG
jgi:hypothetical protein